jgi:ubiquinol-cytochrome c reductase cytochrome b subunit
MKAWVAWIEDRTGVLNRSAAWLTAPVPGGARWRHAWLSLLLGAFLVQVGSGFFLWAHYSPSTQTAWESVHHVQTAVAGGWFLRGLHHFGAQAFVILLGLHVVQLVLTRGCRVPGELAFWCTLAMLPVAVGLSVTGWMLPYDQHGFWAARVPLNLVAITPGVGDGLRVLLLAGPEVSHLTLTRFLSLHAGLLPVVLGLLLAVHWGLSWRRIRRSAEPARAGQAYWPDQAWRDAVVLAGLVGGLVLCVLWSGGAPLGAPADPAAEFSAARPEWFFLWLFQFLKWFPGGTEVWGAIVIPTLVVGVLAVMPWTSRSRAGHRFNLGFVALLGVGAVMLTVRARLEDRNDPVYQSAVARARIEAQQAHELASGPAGIPRDGAAELVRRDPRLQGPRLFAQHCASCHRFDGHDGLGQVSNDPPSAPDLGGFASRAWLTGLLDPERVDGPDYFGGTSFRQGRMVQFVKRDVADFDDEQAEHLRKVILALSAEAELPGQREADLRDAPLIAEGRALLDHEDMRCTECHRFHEWGDDPLGPELTGYGSRGWLIEFVRDPAHARFYGTRNDRMPRFGVEEILDDATLGLIVDWLREGTRRSP